jgi:hypothetical protein
MARHQIEITDMVWEWACKKTGQERPGDFLRDKLTEVMVNDLVGERQPAQLSNVVDLDQTLLKARWKAIGLSPDPLDRPYMDMLDWVRASYDSEEEALEACENKQRSGYDEGGVVAIQNMRRYMMSIYFKAMEREA